MTAPIQVGSEVERHIQIAQETAAVVPTTVHGMINSPVSIRLQLQDLAHGS